MATDLLSLEKTKSAQFSKGDISAKDKTSSPPKTDSGRFKIKEGADKKGIRDGFQRGVKF
jgi:hypothetical protein